MKKKKRSYEKYAKVMNEREISKDPNNIADSMHSGYLRDAMFDINGEMMRKATIRLERSCKWGMIIHLIMFFGSIAMFSVIFPMFLSKLVDANIRKDAASLVHPEYNYSAWLVIPPAALIGVLMTVFANKWLLKKCSNVLYLVNIYYAAVGVMGIIGFWDDMGYILGAVMCVIAVAELFMCNRTHESIEDIEYLVTQEGFPSFNSAMFYMHHSKYVKFREKWEKKHKHLDYFSENEKPIDPKSIIVTASENPDGMDGVSARAEDSAEWLERNKKIDGIPINLPEKHEMEGLSANAPELSDNIDYYAEMVDPKIKRSL